MTRITRRTALQAIICLAGLPAAAVAQAPKERRLIGWLNTSSRQSSGHFFSAFTEALAAAGWREGVDVVIEQRWVDGDYAKLNLLAGELAVMRPGVIVAGPLQSTVAAAKAAPRIPVVQADGGDLVVAGLAASLARPGGMVTGLTNIAGDVAEKHLEFLLEMRPGARRIGFLSDPGNLNLPLMMDGVRRSIARFKVEPQFAEATRPEQIEQAFAHLAAHGIDALVLLKSAMFRVEHARIAAIALRHRWPVITEERALTEAGVLLSYGHDSIHNYRRAAYFVDRILKGTEPGYLPIEQPTRIELVINLKTAKALGIEVPPMLLARADEVIE